MKKKISRQASSGKMMQSRRKMIKGLAGLPFVAGLAAPIVNNLTTRENGSDLNRYLQEASKLKEIPKGKLGNLEITRLIMGCNPMSGYAHARDLLYANTLFKTYHTEQKVIETFRIAEEAGINTTFITNPNFPLLQKYRTEYGGKMQAINQTYLRAADFFGDIDLAIGNGANILYIQGGEADRLVREGKVKELASAIEYIKKKGYTAGIGAHSLEVVKTADKESIPADFFVKTFHHDRYWSAHPESQREEFSVDYKRYPEHEKIHDNMFDLFSSKTKEYMGTVRKPWIAFKVLAGGAIKPADGFRFAFENGADFICVGMFDFQIVADVKTAVEVLSGINGRQRSWYA